MPARFHSAIGKIITILAIMLVVSVAIVIGYLFYIFGILFFLTPWSSSLSPIFTYGLTISIIIMYLILGLIGLDFILDFILTKIKGGEE